MGEGRVVGKQVLWRKNGFEGEEICSEWEGQAEVSGLSALLQTEKQKVERDCKWASFLKDSANLGRISFTN